MYTLTSNEKAAIRTVKLKKSINNMMRHYQDKFGYGQIAKQIPGWQLELVFTPHSNQPISFTATNENGGVYEFELDQAKVNQGWIVINGANATANILVSEWFKELIA